MSTLGKKKLKSKENNFYMIYSPLEYEKSGFETLRAITPLRCEFLPAFCRCALLSLPEALALRLWSCVLTPSRAPSGSGAQLSDLRQGGNSPGALGRVLTEGRGTSQGEGWLRAPKQLDLVHKLLLPPLCHWNIGKCAEQRTEPEQ